MKEKKAIYILGGGLVKEKGKWRTMRIGEGYGGGAMADRLRIDASYEFYKKNPEFFLVASGGHGIYKDILGAPNVCEVLKDELIELGVKEDKILLETNSNNTWQQLKRLKQIIKDNEFSEVNILSNKYHIPRIRAMIEKDAELFKMLNSLKIKLCSAEEILIESNPKIWKEKIDILYNTQDMKNRIVSEEHGVQDIEAGKYKLQ